MLKGNTGSSVNADAKAAGKEAAAAAKGEQDAVKLAYVYASADYDLQALIDGVKEELPGVPVIGNTSYAGVVTPEGYIYGDDGFVGILTISDPDLDVGVAGMEKGNESAEAVGEKVAKLAMQNAGKTQAPAYYYMTAPPAEEEAFVKGITKVIGRVPFFGGSAADNALEGKWRCYTDAGVLTDGVAVAFFYSDKPMTNKFTGAYKETKDAGVITKVVDNRVLAEIDGVPALEKYAQWVGKSVDDLKGGDLLVATITSPLGVKDRLGDLVAVRHPMNGNDDMSMNIGNQLAEGTAVVRLEGTQDDLVNTPAATLHDLKDKMGTQAGAYHLVHCGGRRIGIGDRIDEMVEKLKEEAGDVPFIVEFTFGEYGHEADGANTCGGLMLSFTGFDE